MARRGGTPENLKRPVKGGPSPNPAGRKPKLVTHLNRELAAEGYAPVTPIDVTDAIQSMLNLPISRLQEMAKPTGPEPFLFKLLAKELLGKRGAEALERMLDRAHGKPKQSHDLQGNLAVQAPIVQVQVLPPTRQDG